jgi:hypothetical protein
MGGRLRHSASSSTRDREPWGMAAGCGLVPAWGETDAWANRYHEQLSRSKRTALEPGRRVPAALRLCCCLGDALRSVRLLTVWPES